MKVKVKSLSRVGLFATPWTVAHQASPSMEFSRQEYWSGLPFPSPGNLANPEIKPGSPALWADTLPFEPPGNPLIPVQCLLIFFLVDFSEECMCQRYLTCIFSSVQSLSHVRLFATPRTIAYQAPLSMGFSRQEYWSGLPCPSPRDLPDPGIEPRSPTLWADTLPSEPPGKFIN